MTALRYTLHAGALDAPAHSIDTPDRLLWAQRVLDAAGARRVDETRVAAPAELERAHHPVYVHGLSELSAVGRPAAIDPELVVDCGTCTRAQAAAGAVLAETDRALADPAPIRFCLSRPGSHHASGDFAMGFCVINNLAVAAHHALAAGVERIAICDFDVHHGNGTQDIFWRDGRVLTVSMHQWPFFPGTGAADEVGAGAGRGRNLNLPLGAGRDGRVAVAVWQRALDAVACFDPELVLFEAGFDGHIDDWTSDINITGDDFRAIGTATAAMLDAAGAAAVFELGGGYTEEAVTDGLTGFLDGLRDTPMPS